MDDLKRLRKLFVEEKEDEFEKGKKAGMRWAVEHAQPKLLRPLKLLRGKKVSGPKFLHRCISEHLMYTHRERMSFRGMFGNHLLETEFYSPPFLSGFVDGAATIWDQVRNSTCGDDEDVSQHDGAVQEAVRVESAWCGWYRGDRTRPWLQVLEGATEVEVIERLMASNIPGDKMALPVGQHPDSVQAGVSA